METQKKSSIEKAIIIMELMGREPYEYTAQQISENTGFNIATVYRIIYQLEEYHFVDLDENSKCYRVGPSMYQIGAKYLYNNTYMDKLQNILDEISEICKESVGLAVLDGDKIISVIEIEVHQPMKMNDVPGKYFQPNKGNYGKCITAFRDESDVERYLDAHTFEKTYPATLTEKDELLAEYKKIRKQGYSESVDELGIDILGTGIPLFNKDNRIWGCVSIAFFREDGWEEKLSAMRKLLFVYKDKIEQYLP